jgi:hypothetical protein
MTDIGELIDSICQHPGRYIGGARLDRLELYLIGFMQGQYDVDSDANADVVGRFEEFIQRRNGASTTADGKSWANLIREHCEDDGQAFLEFMILWREFRAIDID